MLIIGLFLTIEQLAIYSLTFLLIESVLFLIKAGIDVFLPRIFKSSKKKKILREILIIFFLSFMVPFLIGSVIHIPIILLFTSKYIEVINYSRIFLFVIPFFILNGFIIPFLIKLNMNKEINISYIISIIVTVILYFLLIPKYSIFGAILSSISFLVVLNISSLILYGFSSKRT